MKTSLGILTVGIVWLFADFSDAQSAYNSVLQSTVHIAEDINNGGFATVVKNIAKTVSPFLNAFSSVVKLIFGTGSTESPELNYLRQLSQTINLKFEQINSQFSDVKKLIDWSAVQISYATLEANIRVVSDHFKRMFEVPVSGINEQKNLFMISYENGYTDSGSKLYAGFMQDNGVISQGLLRPAMKYTENNRGQMRTFMLGILKLLLMAAKVELAYQAIKGYNDIIPFYSHQWEVRIQHVQEKMKEIDLELKNTFLLQAKKDIDKFSLNNLGLSNQNFSSDLYYELSTKYFWRDWLVVVSTHTEGRHDAHSRVCSYGVIKSTHRTKDLVIDSVEKDKPSFDINEVHGLCKSLDGTCSNTATYVSCPQCPHPYHPCTSSNGCYLPYLDSPCIAGAYCGYYTNSENADAIFNWITSVHVRNSCTTFSSFGIIATGKNPVYNAGPTEGNSSRLFVHDLSPCNYKVHFFG